MLILTNLMNLFPVAVVDVFVNMLHLGCVVVTLTALKSRQTAYLNLITTVGLAVSTKKLWCC